jgi:ElaB/YqjD/DUF883 family membrane-anchored ribosome-binding protein
VIAFDCMSFNAHNVGPELFVLGDNLTADVLIRAITLNEPIKDKILAAADHSARNKIDLKKKGVAQFFQAVAQGVPLSDAAVQLSNYLSPEEILNFLEGLMSKAKSKTEMPAQESKTKPNQELKHTTNDDHNRIVRSIQRFVSNLFDNPDPKNLRQFFELRQNDFLQNCLSILSPDEIKDVVDDLMGAKAQIAAKFKDEQYKSDLEKINELIDKLRSKLSPKKEDVSIEIKDTVPAAEAKQELVLDVMPPTLKPAPEEQALSDSKDTLPLIQSEKRTKENTLASERPCQRLTSLAGNIFTLVANHFSKPAPQKLQMATDNNGSEAVNSPKSP